MEFEKEARPLAGRQKMDETNNTDKLVNTTDSLEAVGVFRCWKNCFFVILFLCLLFLQVTFWAVRAGFVVTDAQPTAEQKVSALLSEEVEQIEKAAKAVAADPNAIAQEKASDTKKGRLERFKPKFKHLAALIKVINFVLIFAAVLYCLTMLFILKVSMLGRLGGINHITRAFFLSLIFVVIILPWQKLFPGVVAGMIYTPQELLDSCKAASECTVAYTILYYLRFGAYWIVAVLFLIFAQFRSCRWARAILRRLEVI